ncbi:MAG: hypothetical protein K6360_00535 [Deltaproteobacteria bacterium]
MPTKFFLRFRGVRIRILFPVLTFFIAGTLGMLFFHFRAMEKANQLSKNELATMLLSSVRQAIDHPMRIGDRDAVQRIVTNLKKQAGVYITNEHGRISYSPDAGTHGRDIREILKNAIGFDGYDALAKNADDGARVTSLENGDSGFLIGYQEIANEKACFHCHGASRKVIGAIVVTRDISELVAAARQSSLLMLGLAAAGTALMLPLLAFILNVVAIRPARQLSAKMKGLATGDADLTQQLAVAAVNCSKIMMCGKKDCPSFGKDSHCWYEAGSYAPEIRCPMIKSGEYPSCEVCESYKTAIRTEMDEISTFFNAFMLRIRDLIAKSRSHAEKVGAESSEMLTEASMMAEAAAETEARARDTVSAAGRTNEIVSGVAAAMEEMTATIAEIAKNTDEARHIAQEASTEATDAQEVILRLKDASQKIGEVSRIIGSIAEQTNLLALNATIEAARAGEAGKGFAVVANEVKELAKQTADFVVEIDETVKGLQAESGRAASAVQRIAEVIHKVSEFTDGIAVAVEEQTATTGEISMNAQNARDTADQVTDLGEKILTACAVNSQGAQNVKEASKRLTCLFEELQGLLKEFKV